jgi:hypothetical protein
MADPKLMPIVNPFQLKIGTKVSFIPNSPHAGSEGTVVKVNGILIDVQIGTEVVKNIPLVTLLVEVK